MRIAAKRACSTGLIALCLAGNPAAGASPTERAARPAWTPDVTDVFFDDARTQLIGPRPQDGEGVASAASPARNASASGPTSTEFRWSQLIDGDALADEIKRTANQLATPLASPGKFKSGGHQDCRRDFAALGLMFAVVAEHDDEVRWKADAAALATKLAALVDMCRKPTDDSYAAAIAGKGAIDDLLRGQPADTSAEEKDQPRPSWSEIAPRPLVMQRMEQLQTEALAPPLANERAFRRDAATLARDAQVLAVLAEIIVRDDYDYRDDEEYLAPARKLKISAREIFDAATAGKYDAARAAATRAGQACNACHEGFRG